MPGVLQTAKLWLPTYLRQRPEPLPTGIKDVMICVCDHYEPLHHADKAEAMKRLARWRDEYPKVNGGFRDFDGVSPRHTYFFPIEQNDPDLLAGLQEVVHATCGEVEVHLHHDGDTPRRFCERMQKGIDEFREKGFLSTDPTGRLRFAFVHGDWALDNSHPLGRHCGVNNEIAFLRDLGCYADFTMPSAPDWTQTRTVNRIYYAMDCKGPKSHDFGVEARVLSSGPRAQDDGGNRFGDLLMVQGPLGLNWKWRKHGILPRLENADLTGANPPTALRMDLWTKLHVHVVGQPEWVFIKLHTHGAPPPNCDVFLGDPYRRFHEHLAEQYGPDRSWRLHYVTAREMVNIIHAAEDGHRGNAGMFRDYRFKRVAEEPAQL
jgi:hypothetical protein